MFAYLWRRFGPPNGMSDDLKDLCTYILTTPMEGVILGVSPKPSGMPLTFIGGVSQII